MSQENVELVKAAYEAFNRRDLDTMLALAHDEVVVESRLVAIEGGYRGLEGVRRWWTNMLDVLPDYKVEAEEVRDLGDVTLARIRARGHGADSATPLEETVWQAVRWQDGKYVWWRTFQREAEALEAAGLSE
jgi:ketosteroid isomerase-like protein